MQLKNVPKPHNSRIATVHGNTLFPISNTQAVPLSITHTKIVLCCTTYKHRKTY